MHNHDGRVIPERTKEKRQKLTVQFRQLLCATSQKYLINTWLHALLLARLGNNRIFQIRQKRISECSSVGFGGSSFKLNYFSQLSVTSTPKSVHFLLKYKNRPPLGFIRRLTDRSKQQKGPGCTFRNANDKMHSIVRQYENVHSIAMPNIGKLGK